METGTAFRKLYLENSEGENTMRRQDKYPETETFHYHNENPKNRLTTDCVARAIAVATGIPYNDVVIGLAEIHCSTGYHSGSNECISRFMEKAGFVKHKQPRKSDGRKYTGSEFCEFLNRTDPFGKTGGIVANIGGNHTVCIKPTDTGGLIKRFKVFDTWDSTGSCIGNYWTKIK